jgi:hypothetical protein
VPIEGICVARVLTRPSVAMHRYQPAGRSVPSTSCNPLNTHAPGGGVTLYPKASEQMRSTSEISCPPDSITLMIANFSEEKLTITKGMILGVAQEITENLVFSADGEEDTDRSTEHSFRK